MSKYKKIKILVLLVYFIGVSSFLTYLVAVFRESIPNNIYIEENMENKYEFNLPVVGSLVYNDNDIPIDLTKPLTIKASQNGTYPLDVKLFGIYKLKTININVVEKQQVILGGFPLGIYVKYDGVMVAQVTKVTNYLGNEECPCKDKLYKGDYIMEIDGQPLQTKEQFAKMVSAKGDSEMILTVKRNNEFIKIKVKSVLCADKSYKLGVWVRDDTQGVGTVTYILPDGRFGALGHAIADMDTGRCVNISSGKIYETKIISIIPGRESKPGEFVGIINYSNKYYLGDIYKNTDYGIFGKFEVMDIIENPKIADVAYSSQIKEGEAYIRSYLNGEAKEYKIEITKVDLNSKNSNKGIEFKVTDINLLEITNGIVQGMSGSPIIQDGKIIGAVTHVLVDDPSKGYGIFIETMLKY